MISWNIRFKLSAFPGFHETKNMCLLSPQTGTWKLPVFPRANTVQLTDR